MKRSFLLLIAIVLLLFLVTMSSNAGTVPFFYFLILLVSIVSTMTGSLRLIKGERSVLSWIYVFFSIIIFILSYYLVMRQR